MNGKTKGVAAGRCQGCNHPERARIERFLAAGASIKGAARKFAINYHPSCVRQVQQLGMISERG
jgi:hypothetical protein